MIGILTGLCLGYYVAFKSTEKMIMLDISVIKANNRSIAASKQMFSLLNKIHEFLVELGWIGWNIEAESFQPTNLLDTRYMKHLENFAVDTSNVMTSTRSA